MYNYKIKTNFVSPEMPKGCANKTGFNIIIVHFYNTIRYMIFHYGLEPVLIHRILISFEAILEILLFRSVMLPHMVEYIQYYSSLQQLK